MPLDKFVLILVIVLAAAGATVWLAVAVGAAVSIPMGWLILLPIAALAVIAWRVISERLANREDDHYDRME
ncbi:hypothetical protein [Jannaschia sp. M317]|uniref:hypothetical protein n=1 Tax=Jannaschia sp. M317 TaxID=2867011 RepID=UPI0021A84EAD|nr:hypothetical protein [Jannaschia sp. M317]UWQ16339.1 hypothetical protein K3551_10410 [Jannaschia sp. M317]